MSASRWTVTKAGEDWECRLDGRLRAIIRKAPRSARPWLVTRVTTSTGGRTSEGGSDDFRTLAAAREFVTDNPGVWGA